MGWSDRIIQALAEHKSWAYHGDTPSASEPAALAALALLGHDRPTAATAALDWLAGLQVADGSIGVTASQNTPNWTTSQAILAWWHAEQRPEFAGHYASTLQRAIDWTLQAAGTALPQAAEWGHNSMLIGWPWVDKTHSWMEPTSWSVLALRTAGRAAHPRTVEGMRLMVDRLLSSGGCNYGNTYILGQELRPHVQPTGVCLLALGGEPIGDSRIPRSIEYLERELSEKTTTISLSCGLLGLAAQDRLPAAADRWLAAAAHRTLQRDPSAYKLALLALAALGENSPLIVTRKRSAAS